MVAGGGASVVYADTIADFAGIGWFGYYGEYSEVQQLVRLSFMLKQFWI